MLCCQGKSEIAERQTKQYILSFAVCANTIIQAGDFWPVKHAILSFVYHAFMDTADPSFLQSASSEDDSGCEEQNGEETGESDVSVLLKIV